MCNVRVISKRHNINAAKIGESVIDISRTSIFGNPYPMYHEGQRDEVIEKFRVYLGDHYHSKSPLWGAVEALAERVQNGERLALQCWCAPLACHGDVLVKAINWINDPKSNKEST